jgi:hypothetical protein
MEEIRKEYAMKLRPLMLASAITLVTASGAFAQTTQPSDGRPGGAGPMSNTPATDPGARTAPNANRDAAPMTTPPSASNPSTAPRGNDATQMGNRQGTPGATNPTDGRTGGAGPMSGNPQTDRTLERNPGMRAGDGHRDVRGDMSRADRKMMASEDVRKIQEALQAKGHDVGGIDGIMGPRTQQALREFQQQQGIERTGRIDQATRSALGV